MDDQDKKATEIPAFLRRRPVGAGDGGTYVVGEQWYQSEIERLQRELAACIKRRRELDDESYEHAERAEKAERELADTVDMLKQCAERNDAIESLNERLERDLSESKRALLVPGVMSCAKCNFRLYRRNLYMQSGTVGPGGNETEPCPNGCGPLWPVTWKREASENLTLAEEAHADRAKAERERNEARAIIERWRGLLNEAANALGREHEGLVGEICVALGGEG